MGLPGVKLSESEPSGRTAAVLNEQLRQPSAGSWIFMGEHHVERRVPAGKEDD